MVKLLLPAQLVEHDGDVTVGVCLYCRNYIAPIAVDTIRRQPVGIHRQMIFSEVSIARDRVGRGYDDFRAF